MARLIITGILFIKTLMKKELKYSAAAINLALFLLVSAGCKQRTEIPRLSGGEDHNLLIITLDTTRADRIGCYGYQDAETPSIDSLAKNGVRFENCYASVPLTLPSHVTLFTGREPVSHLVRNNGTYVLRANETTLAEIMKNLGYLTHAVTASFVLHSKFGLNQGFDFYDDSLDFTTAANNLQTEIDAEKVYSRFQNWLGKNHTKKFFSWVHFYDPHNPYDPPSPYKERFKNDYYDGEIAYMDHFVGKIIEDLNTLNILNRTLVVIVGDHGEAFGEHREYGHGIFCYEESIKVPLIFSHPDIFKEDNQVVSQRVCLADILPTILNLYGIDIPSNAHGKSLAPLFFRDSGAEETQIYLESMFANEDMGWAPLTGMILNHYKYISLPNPELYDLMNDPGERDNLFQEENSLAKEIDDRLREYIQSHLEVGGEVRRKLTIADKRRLESLGYISGFSSRSREFLDPKDGIELMNEVMAVKDMFDEGKTEEAERKLEGLLNSNQKVKIPLLYDNLFNLYKDQGDQVKALEILEEAVELFPDQVRFRLNLALQYLEVGRNVEAQEMCLDMIEDSPDLAQVYNLLGGIYKAKGELDEAVSFFEKAREVEPLNVLIQLNHAEVELERNHHSQARIILDALLNNEVLMSAPESFQVRIRMGILLAKSGDYDRAIGLFLRLIENQNANSEVWTHLGLAYFETGDLQKAQDAYNRSLEMDEDYALTLSSLGTLNLALFQRQRERQFHTRAVEFYQRAIAADPEIATAYNGLAVAFRYQNRNEQAVSLWKKALEIKPDFTNVYINLGITLIAIGQRAEALKYLTLCRDRYFSRLDEAEQAQLQELIAKAK